MIDFLLVIIGGIGGTFVMTHSKLLLSFRVWVTDRNRKIGEMISCPQCFGVYMGLISYLLVRYNLDILVYGLAVSGASFLINKKI